MNTKRQRAFSIAICIIFIFVTFASLFYVVKEENHHCTGDECPICACIHQAEQTLKNLETGVVLVHIISPIVVLFALMLASRILYVCGSSLVRQKVRLNN